MAPGQFTEKPSEVSVGPGDDAELITYSAVVGGLQHTAYYQFTHQYLDRYEGVAMVTWCTCDPLSTPQVQQVSSAVATQVGHLASTEP